MANLKFSELKGNEFKPYGTDEALDALVDSSVYSDRYTAAIQAYGLDKLVDDPEWGIRAQVATNGYALDILVDDHDDIVRAAAVRSMGRERRKAEREDNAKKLEKYLDNESRVMRYALAEQGFGIEVLMKDKDPYVRAGTAIAASDEQLNTLIKDPSPYVRLAVVGRRYGLDTLINDTNPYVSEAASKMKSELIER